MSSSSTGRRAPRSKIKRTKRPPSTKNVVVQDCEIGRGVFARRFIYADEQIDEVTGELTMDGDLDPRYCIEMDGDWYLVPAAPFRYLNHSCTPNCNLFMWEDEERQPGAPSRKLFLGALRDIEQHEELTIDYAWPAHFAIPCECQSKGCRAWIVDASELDELLADLDEGEYEDDYEDEDDDEGSGDAEVDDENDE